METPEPATSEAGKRAAWAYVAWGAGWLTALLLVLWTRYLHAGFLGELHDVLGGIDLEGDIAFALLGGFQHAVPAFVLLVGLDID